MLREVRLLPSHRGGAEDGALSLGVGWILLVALSFLRQELFRGARVTVKMWP